MTKPKFEPLRRADKSIITCAHNGCSRPAVRRAQGRRRHVQFKREAHNCCSHHSKE